ncbi:MAG: hypothetical protein CVU28_13035 [Betaproteobacteria bacterium HGW-Betaproteobacteria-21]|nr:MAG: hypothetical protein CVU28_13035 [Betaproteobacteria bacterium HGW-Betaproteobacteria-21]
MFATRRVIAALLACLFVLGPGFVLAQAVEPPSAPRPPTQLEKRASALLERAVKHIEATGEAGSAAFSREADFVDRDLYAYAFRTDGEFLASGGYSAALIGTNVLGFKDTEGKAFFREMVAIALEQGMGRVEYHWFNPADSRGEPKVTLFRKVGNVIVAVGYYSPRATPIQAKAMLKAAAKALDDDPATALADFQRIDGRFIRDDLYVFAVDIASGKFLAHGASPVLVGTDAHLLQDAHGRRVVTEMLDVLRKKDNGELKYQWMNPASGRQESKHTYFREVDGKLVGVGYYIR